MTTAESELRTEAKSIEPSPRMKALIYRTSGHGPGTALWEDKPRPSISEPSDVILRITTTTICGTDLHILKGDVPTVIDGRILGHEGIGIVDRLEQKLRNLAWETR